MAHLDVNRFQRYFSPTLNDVLERTLDVFSSLSESPIEALLGAALWVTLNSPSLYVLDWDSKSVALCRSPLEPRFTEAKWAITPQYAWYSYRIDWVIRTQHRGQLYFIECDGFAFHERTPEQAERDRTRDREVQQAGIPILRFTGSEINRDPFACAGHVISFVCDHGASK